MNRGGKCSTKKSRTQWSVISPIAADPRRPYAMKTDAIVGIKVTETFSKASGRLGKRFFYVGRRRTVRCVDEGPARSTATRMAPRRLLVPTMLQRLPPTPTSPPVSVRTNRDVIVSARGSDGRARRTGRPAGPCACRAALPRGDPKKDREPIGELHPIQSANGNGAHSRFPGHALTPTGVMAIRCKQFHLPDL